MHSYIEVRGTHHSQRIEVPRKRRDPEEINIQDILQLLPIRVRHMTNAHGVARVRSKISLDRDTSSVDFDLRER